MLKSGTSYREFREGRGTKVLAPGVYIYVYLCIHVFVYVYIGPQMYMFMNMYIYVKFYEYKNLEKVVEQKY
jgi:hypothetical protein